MKKRTSIWMLIALAAMALVFAAGCDTSGDSASGGVLSGLIAGTMWTYESERTSGKKVDLVILDFASEGNTVTLVAAGNDGSNSVQSASPCGGNTSDTGGATVTYSVSGNTVTITSATASTSDATSLDESAVIVLELDDDTIATGELSDGESKLVVQSVSVGSVGINPALTVATSRGYTLDILGSDVSGAVAAQAEFKYE